MKNSAYFIFTLMTWLMTSCSNPQNNSATEPAQQDASLAEKKDSAVTGDEYAHDHMEDKDSLAGEGSEIATLYLVITDTGTNYPTLLQRMVTLKEEMGVTIDSMDRYYDSKKKKIILPANHEDELYAGRYFPRRFPSTDLSVEYLETYLAGAGKNTMAVVAGIFEKEKSADSTLKAIRQTDKDAFKLKTELYLGCAH